MSRAPSGASRISRAGTAEKLSVILLLAFFLFLGLNAARSQGQTVDETFYNGAGYPMVRYQDYRFLGEHPPFAMQWGSLPLLFLQPKFPINKPVRLKGQQGMDISANGARFLYTQGNDPYVLLFLERMMILLLGLLTGVMLYAWAKSLAGAGGALAALTLFILNPDILAHGSLFTSDLPVTAFFFGACAAAAAWFRTGHFRILAAAGILTGLALLSKMSALVLIPGLSLLFVLDILENRNRPPRPAERKAAAALILLAPMVFALALTQTATAVTLAPLALAALGTLLLPSAPRAFRAAGWILMVLGAWLCFREAMTLNAPGPLRLVLGTGILSLPVLARALAVFQGGKLLIRLRAPLFTGLCAALMLALGYTDWPRTLFSQGPYHHFIQSLQIALNHARSGHAVCLEGSWIPCDWRYFPALFAAKMPLGTLLLIAGGTAALVMTPLSRMQKACVLLPPLVFLGISAAGTSIRIGIRHLLPIYPFLFLSGGFLWTAGNKHPALRILAAAGLALTAFSVLPKGPDYIPYFNAFAGSPRKAAALTADSNLSWGQDNKRLALWAFDNGVSSLVINGLTLNADEFRYLGLNWRQLEDSETLNPAPGFYALDLTVYYREQSKPGSWFENREPFARAGKTWLIFKKEGAS